MFLLPLLTGFLLLFQGHGYSVHGYRNVAVRELEDYNKLLDALSSKYRQILDVQEQRQQEQEKKDDPQVEWSDVGIDNVNVPNKALRNDVDFAAAADDDDGEDAVNKDAGYAANEDDTQPSTTEQKGTTTTTRPEDLPKAHKFVGNPESGVSNNKDFVFLALVTACSVAGFIGLIMAGVCWYKLHKKVKAASDVDYPAYGVTGPTKERLPSPGDRKLAQSAQMYHYQHQKQQMIAMEKANGEMKQDGSEDESEEENEEGDYTVYECPGLAPTGEMEVRNPLFTEETQTPVNGQPVTNGLPEDKEQE